MQLNVSTEYRYKSTEVTCSNKYLWPAVQKILSQNPKDKKRVFEIGCGNGATANMLSQLGYEVIGIDPSKTGIQVAKKAYPHIQFFEGDAYDDLSKKYGIFPIVISLEVIEHCYYPRKFAKTFYDLLTEDGIGIISTPYHGYLKYLAIAVIGKMDNHLTALWDGGHIKFWSKTTLHTLLKETGFRNISFVRVGRIPAFAKSMIALVRK